MLENQLIGYASALLAGLFFGLSDALVRAASVKIKPFQNLLISLILGLPFLWIFAIIKGLTSMSFATVLYFVIAGLLNFVIGRLLFYISIANVGATAASILTSPTVIVSSLLAWILLGEDLTFIQITGIILVVVSVLIVSLKPSGESLHGGKTSVGIAAGLASTIVFAVTAILVRQATNYMGGDPLVGVAISYTSALPIVVLMNDGIPNLRSLPKKHFYFMSTAALVVASAQLSRYLAFNYIKVAEASVMMSLFPFFTLLFTLLLEHEVKETAKPIHLFAASLAVTGVILTNYIGVS